MGFVFEREETKTGKESKNGTTVYRNTESLSPQQWYQLSQETGLSSTELKNQLWRHMEGKKRGMITAQKKRYLLEFLKEHSWKVLSRKQLDMLQEEVQLNRFQIHGLVLRLRMAHWTGSKRTSKEDRKQLRQLLDSRGYTKNHLFTKNEMESLERESRLNRLQIYQELRRRRDPPGALTFTKRDGIREWYFKQIDALLKGQYASTDSSSPSKRLPAFPEQMRQSLQLSKEQIRKCIYHVHMHELSPGQEFHVTNWTNANTSEQETTKDLQSLCALIHAHPQAVNSFFHRRCTSIGRSNPPSSSQKESIRNWLSSHDFRKPSKQEYQNLQNETGLSAKQVYYLVSSFRKTSNLCREK